MRRKLQLYIAGRQVDMGNDSWVLFNWIREDMANPTAVINSSSHQFDVPGTCRNNALFGEVFRLDRRTVLGIRYDGTNFDPMRKTPFMLYDERGTLLESGYCRLDGVNTRNLRHTYTLSLYGGLGSFFYSLASKDDGTPRTLFDLIWTGDNGEDVETFNASPVPRTVDDAWGFLVTGESDWGIYHFWNCINFAPCYNGIPGDFDASHALMNEEAYRNMPAGVDEDGERPYEYTYKAGLDCALVSFTNPHTEWELGDLRWYLQRPVVSVKAFVEACCDPRNNGGYEVDLDETFFNDDNPAYASAWWTLGMIATEDRGSVECLANVLRASKTPMDYLVSYCKVYGLLFLWDSSRRKASIVTRATFYTDGTNVLDLSGRVDRESIRQTPVLADKRWYEMGDGGKGQFVEQYAQDYGKGYAVQRIDTGYEFDAGTMVLTEGQTFKDAAEVQESDLLFSETSRIVSGRDWVRYFPLPRWEKVTYELWNEAGESKSFDMACDQEVSYWDEPAAPGADWLPKVQLHGEDNKTLDGADVLVYFEGVKDTPTYSAGTWNVHKSYFLTGDDPAMTDLAGGPCWDLRRAGIMRVSLPSFRRVHLSGRYIVESFEWGVPAARPVLNITYPGSNPGTIYGRWWKAYLSDRYQTDTRVMTCKVNLRGMEVGQGLLRRFYWYDNALWSLNAIRNHSLTTWDLTECEFVKVNRKEAYTRGPGSQLSQYLTISPDSSRFSMNPGGETLVLEVSSSSSWSLSLSSIVSWLTASPASGAAGVTQLSITVPSNTTGGRRATTVTLTNQEGETLSFDITQAQKTPGDISLSPASITIPATGTSMRGRSSMVTASGAWDLDRSTQPAWLTVYKSISGLTLQAGANAGAERNASLKVYLTGDPDTWATLSVTQEAGEGGNGGITLKDGNGNSSATVQAAGGSLTLYVTVPDAAEWTISKSENWVSVSPVSGSDNGTLAVTIPAYTGSSDRQATITATRSGYTEGAVFYVIQAAPAVSADYVELVRYPNNGFWNSDDIQASGVQGWAVSVQAVGSWSCETPNSWIHPSYTSTDPWSGSGYATIYFAADANAGAARTGTIVATCLSTGETSTFYVYQAGDGTLTLYASFNKGTIDASAQTIYLIIQASQGLSWSIDQISTGLSLLTTSGSGPAEIAVNVAAYTGGTQRTLSLRVRNASTGLSATPSVIQFAPSATNYLRVTPFGEINVAQNNQRTDFAVESDTSWQVTGSLPSDVRVSPSYGSGNATVMVTYDSNLTGASRSFTLTFATTAGTSIQKTATIVQAGQSGMDVTVSPQVVNLAGNGDAVFVTLGSTGNWTASKSDSWITVSPTYGSAGQGQTLTIGAEMNNGGARSGIVTVACGSISRQIIVNQATASALLVSSNAVTLEADSGSEDTITVYASGMWELDEYSNIWVDAIYTAHGGNSSGESLTFRTKSANTSGSSRSVTIRVRLTDNQNVYQEIIVTQLSQSVLYVSPTAMTKGNGTGTDFIHVTCNTEWSITQIDEGLSVNAAAQSGDGDADVMFLYTANPNPQTRKMRIYFQTEDETKQAMFTVNQEAGQAPIQISPDSALWFETGEESVLTATRVVTCTQAWTAVSSEGWLTFSPSSGAANTPVTVNFTARGSLSQVLSAIWTVTSGNNTKSLNARCIPAPTETETD